ncbi:hypothetical protein ACVC7T_10640 [Streptococcus sp. P25B114]
MKKRKFYNEVSHPNLAKKQLFQLVQLSVLVSFVNRLGPVRLVYQGE